MKTVLAIEVSSPQGSLALIEEGREPVTRSWTEDRFRNQHVFEELKLLLDEAGVELAAVSQYVVGRGPGTFSSLRIALGLARAAALPGRANVYALASGEALAAEVLAASGAARVAVVGDARRGSFWYAVFDRGANDLPRPAEWKLCTAETFLGAMPGDATVVTSSRQRLEAALPREVFQRRSWIAGDRFPRALWLGRCCEARRAAGRPSESLTPLYMHPPVR